MFQKFELLVYKGGGNLTFPLNLIRQTYLGYLTNFFLTDILQYYQSTVTLKKKHTARPLFCVQI